MVRMGSFLPQDGSGSATFFCPVHPIILLFSLARLGRTKYADKPKNLWVIGWVPVPEKPIHYNSIRPLA